MAKLSQAQIKEMADRVVELERKMLSLEEKRGKEIEPFRVAFERDTADINAKYDAKAAKLREERDTIYGEVVIWLESQGKVMSLEGEKAVAVNELVVGKRVIDPETFFDKARFHGRLFWDCLTVGIAKAEKLIGATAVDEMATKESKLVASVKAK